MTFGFGVGDFIAVLELVNKVRKDFQSAPSQFEDISNEVRSLSIVLSDVDVTVSELELDPYQRNDLQHVISSCRDVLERLEDTLDKYTDLHAEKGRLGSRVKKAWKRINWEPDDIRELRERITLNTTLLNTFLGGISSQTMYAIKHGVDRLNLQQDNEQRLETLNWLTPLDYAAQQQDFISRRQPGTGKWLLDSKEYQNWLTTVGHTLFCPGMPGAGKTILTSTVVEDLPTRFLGDAKTAVAYIYFNFRRQDDQKLTNLMACILRQSIQHLDRIPDSVNALKDKFLLAQIFLDSLDDKLTPKSIRSGLKDFQKHSQGSGEAGKAQALDFAYEQAMERINNQKPGLREIALQVLAWITCAKRPLTQPELQNALAVELGTLEFDEENLPDIQGTVSACCGLVTIENESSIIRLVHYTTQEYFERTQTKWFPDANEEMAMICITYLSFNVFGAGFCDRDEKFTERLLAYPLYNYAAHHWDHHARAACTPTEEIIEFLENRQKVEAAGQALLYSKVGLELGATPGPKGMTGLHLAAIFGLESIVKTLLDRGNIDPNSASVIKFDGDMTALSYAAEAGHEAVVKLLLEKDNVDPDAKNASLGNFGRTPLSYAAEKGHASIVELLVKTGRVDIEAQDSEGSFDLFTFPGTGWTPLCVAAEKGHYEVVKILLDHGADVNHQPDDGPWKKYKSALERATENGHEAIVELLLEKIESDVKSKEECD
ncbi:hypothetical protein CDV31_015738 [Fusarium ambrosium]|uniref:Uncharacterized protein n=1 Tax=Fusarium ambrosium TaxID=131363 RepID=A0A428SK68_9HYPO|nr:hypothetical protein CDV31_015738 [Fusarium ambrosium]